MYFKTEEINNIVLYQQLMYYELCKILNYIYFKNAFENSDHLIQGSLKRDHVGISLRTQCLKNKKVSLRQFISGC